MGVVEALKSMFSKERSLTSAEEKLQNAFSSVHSDIFNLKLSLKALHAGTQLTKQDIQNTTAWLGYLKRDSERAEKNFEKISSWLIYLQETGQKNRKEIEKLQEELEMIKQQVLQRVATGVVMKNSIELKPKTTKSTNDVATGVANVGNVVIPTFTTSKDLPNPQKALLNLLLAVGEPMSYGQIAQKTGKSKITLRVNMSALKKRGLVEEHNTPSGTKLFTASSREKVKMLYNVEVL